MQSKSSTHQSIEFNLKGQSFILHAYRAMFWKAEKTIIISDLHLGKSQHFRKNGIGVPADVSTDNFNRLHHLIHGFKPNKVLILGDLFHSVHNIMWDVLKEFVGQYPNVSFNLIPGNHDILEDSDYQSAGIEVLDPVYEKKSFIFTHHPLENQSHLKYVIHGHIHPAVRLRGKGRQSMRLAAFYFGPNTGILPAFGAFTGLATIYPDEGDRVFGVYKNSKVIDIEC